MENKEEIIYNFVSKLFSEAVYLTDYDLMLSEVEDISKAILKIYLVGCNDLKKLKIKNDDKKLFNLYSSVASHIYNAFTLMYELKDYILDYTKDI